MGEALTRTEAEILSRLAEGMEPQEIADATFTSVRTVQWHMANLSKKFGSPNPIRWMLPFGRWVPHSEAAVPAEAPPGKPVAEKPVEPEKPVAEKCGSCGYRRPLDPVIVGQMFTVRMCQPCQGRLAEARSEAAERRRRELETLEERQPQEENDAEGVMPGLASAQEMSHARPGVTLRP